MRVVLLTLLLSGCSLPHGVSVAPGLHCTGPIGADIAPGTALLEGVSARLADVWEHCGPMLRVNIDSYTGE